MQIIWLGFSCFLLKTDSGKRILMDPFKNLLINNEIPKSDIITFSHDSKYMDIDSYKDDRNIKLITNPGLFNYESIKILGLPTFHDSLNGLKRGPNIIYLLYVDNLCICHLGSLGTIPNNEIMNQLKNIDILFIPIDENFTLETSQSIELCKTLSPKIIIPMNYSTHNTKIHLSNSKNFIMNMENIIKIESNSIYSSDFKYDLTKTIILKNPI